MDKDEYSTLFNATWKEGSGHYPPNSVTLTMELKMIRDWIYTFQEWRETKTQLENETERKEIIGRYKERRGAETAEMFTHQDWNRISANRHKNIY